MQAVIVNKEDVENTSDNPVLEAAKSYIARGWSVIPVVPGGKSPAIQSWKPYQSRLATPEELELWFGTGDANIGIVTGKLSGLTVLDFDTTDAWSEGIKRKVPMETPLVKTSKGWHLYCRHHEAVKNDQHGQVLQGMDIRSEGGYVVAPPSIHESGDQYCWYEGKSPDDVSLAELPDWVINAKRVKTELVDLEEGAKEGNRNDDLTRLAGKWVKEMSLEDVIETALAWNLKCDPPDDEQQVLRTVKSIWEREHAGLPQDIGPADWEEPVLFDNEALPMMSASLLPSYLGEFAGAVSKSIQAPEGMASLLGLSIAATALQKKVVVSPVEGSDHIEPVNMWTVVVADPSERKSPVLREMRAPVVDWEQEQYDRIKEEKAKADTERAIIESRIKKLNTEAGNADTSEKRAEIATQINELKTSIPDDVRAPDMWTGSVTTEQLEQLMVDNNEKMAVLNDEGGIFEIMGGLYSNGKVNLDIFMQGYSGNPTRSDRASRNAHMKNPLLTFGLAIQPKVLEDLSHGSKRTFRGTGLLARFLYYQCESFRGQRFYANQQQVSPEIRNRYFAGIKSLLNIHLEHDEHGNATPRTLHLDDEARDLWIAFHDEIERKLVRGGEFDLVADWAGKLAGNTLRVAGIFHVVEHGVTNRAINRETVERAIQLMRVLIPHAKSALNATTSSGLAKDAEHVCEWIMNNEMREFAKRDCQRAMQSRFPTVKNLEPVLSELVGRNIIRVKSNPKGMGRPSSSYEANPSLFN